MINAQKQAIDFTGIDFPSEITASLREMNVNTPTKIQAEAIPSILAGQDILASSQTGSGKTLAYLLPIISLTLKSGGRTLILTPTRELAMQVSDIVNKMAKKTKVFGVSIVGGQSFFKQNVRLKSNPAIIVGTPGRMIDHLNRGTIKLGDFRYLVLDEMDSMLDMGMKKQVDQLFQKMSKQTQVLMFSATVPGHILEISRQYLKNPKRIIIGSATKPAPEVEQKFLKIAQGSKYTELNNQLTAKEGTAIVFVTTKRSADRLTDKLIRNGHKADVIHGGLNQNKRSNVLAGFRAEKTRILVATDIAARGLDVTHIKYVFNYDLPMAAEDYLHRIGRTGRAGAKGEAISFVSPEENGRLRAIEKLIDKGESSPRESFKKKKNGPPRQDFGAQKKKRDVKKGDVKKKWHGDSGKRKNDFARKKRTAHR